MHAELTVDRGDVVTVAVAFTNADGDPADPSTVTFAQRDPTGAIATETFPASGTPIVNDDVGSYHLDVAASRSGMWHVRMEGTGAVTAAATERFYVRPDDFEDVEGL